MPAPEGWLTPLLAFVVVSVGLAILGAAPIIDLRARLGPRALAVYGQGWVSGWRAG